MDRAASLKLYDLAGDILIRGTSDAADIALLETAKERIEIVLNEYRISQEQE